MRHIVMTLSLLNSLLPHSKSIDYMVAVQKLSLKWKHYLKCVKSVKAALRQCSEQSI